MNSLRWLVFGCLSLGSLGAQVTALNERIAVSSTAAPDYVRATLTGGALKPESYIFTRGHFLGGGTVDRGLQQTSFESLARKLAPDLAKQSYLPTRDVASADLLIVVHWGTSMVFDDSMRDTQLERLNGELASYRAAVAEVGGVADVSALNSVSYDLQNGQDNAEFALQQNAKLLGYTRTLNAAGGRDNYQTEQQKFLAAELSEERYFVVLMAYDYQAMRKTKESKLLWVTRLSVRSPGNNFTEALPVLSQAGSHVYGRNVDDLVHVKANLRTGRVSFGEMKVLASAEETPPAARK